MLLMGAQLFILAGVLHSRQGAAYWFLIPFFTLLYGPVLLSVRFVGTWAGVRQVLELRRKEDRLQHEGLAPGRGRRSGRPDRAAPARSYVPTSL
jgi:hypothetical protein